MSRDDTDARSAVSGQTAGRDQAMDLVAAASHDLRGAVSTVYGSVKTLRSGWEELRPEQRDSLLDVTLRQLELFSRRLDNILSLATIGVPAQGIELDLVALVDGCVFEARVLYPVREIETTLPETPLAIVADRERLRRIVGALVDNALKYSGDLVEVEVAREDGRATLLVRDRGPGIAAADREGLFRPFVRLEAAPGTSGTGLGLFLARTFTEELGGTIGVDSAPGEGATFRVSLPLV